MESKFNRLYKLIMQQYEQDLQVYRDIITINPLAKWQSLRDALMLQRVWRRQYNVEAEFYDGGEQNSRWKLVGNRKNIKRLLRNQWPAVQADYQRIITDPKELAILKHEIGQTITIDILSQQTDNNNILMLKNILERKYNIDAEFHKNDNQQSIWHLIGDKRDIKKALKREFNIVTPDDIYKAFNGNVDNMKLLFFEQIQGKF